MGDRVQHAKPEGYEERKQKTVKKRQAQREFELEAPQQKRRVSVVMHAMSLQSLSRSVSSHTCLSFMSVITPRSARAGWGCDEP